MKVKMKKYEQLAIENSNKYKDWAHVCIAKDAYLEGYKRALKNAQEFINEKRIDCQYYLMEFDVGTEEVEIEFEDGDHQLSQRALNKIVIDSN